MAIYTTTALGRDVPQSESGTVMQDLVLKVLYDFRMSAFNSKNVPMTRTMLANAAGLSPQDVDAAAESLIPLHHVERVPSTAYAEPLYRITGSGVIFVRNIQPGILGLLR